MCTNACVCVIVCLCVHGPFPFVFLPSFELVFIASTHLSIKFLTFVWETMHHASFCMDHRGYSWGFKCIIFFFFFLKRIAHWRQSNHYLLKIQSAEFGLLPKLPFALCICIIQLARQLLRVAILFCCFGFI